MSTEHPILFSTPMVRAILAGQKTVTRRAIRGVSPGADRPLAMCGAVSFSDTGRWITCPYGAPGDRLWVRETWRADDYDDAGTIYVADLPAELFEEAGDLVKWRPSIHMPRNRSRLTLAVEDVRVERLCSLDDSDAIREGIPAAGDVRPFARFAELWDRINGKRAPWESNPWVWRVAFRRLP